MWAEDEHARRTGGSQFVVPRTGVILSLLAVRGRGTVMRPGRSGGPSKPVMAAVAELGGGHLLTGPAENSRITPGLGPG